MTAACLNAFQNGNSVMLLFRNAEGEMRGKPVPAEYVSYFERDEWLDGQLRKHPSVKLLKYEGKWMRVTWDGYDSRKRICEGLAEQGIKTYEADLDPVRRLVLDVGLPIAKPRRVYLDIETDSRVPFSRKEEMRVLSWALCDDDGNATSAVLEEDTDGAEKMILETLWEALRPYDQVLAWYGDGFDFPVIFARTQARGIAVNAFRWLWLDQKALFERMHTSASGQDKTSMRLQDVCMATLGEGKNEFDASKTWEAWAAGGESRERLVKYNIQDTALLPKLEAKTGYASLFQSICEVCHVFPDTKSLNPTRQMDGYMLRLGLLRGHHFATKNYDDVVDAPFKGAFVMQPEVLKAGWREKRKMSTGFLRGVHVADFAGLYPSIILTWNMSPDTKVMDGQGSGYARSPSTAVSFRTDTQGILTEALRELVQLRKVWNDKKQDYAPRTPDWYDMDRRSTAYKVAANSFYGVVGSPYSRFFDKYIAEAVTQSGVWLIKKTIEAAERRGFDVVYGDTDSIFVLKASRPQFEEFVTWCNKELYPQILKEQGCTENHIKLAYEKEFRLIIFTAAKRYVGKYEHYKGKAADQFSKPEIKGLEFNRGDATKLAHALQGQVIDALMEESEDLSKYHELLSRMRTYVLEEPKMPIEEVRRSQALSRNADGYVAKSKIDGTAASLPPHVVVAKILEQRGQAVTEGTRIEYVVVDGAAAPMKVIPAEDYTGECDRFYIWESMVYPPAMRLLENAFPNHDWEAWAKVRPPKIRKRSSVVSDNQAALPGFGKVLNLAASIGRPKRPYKIRIRESVNLEQLYTVCQRYPGTRPLLMTLVFKNGTEADFNCKSMLVDGSEKLTEELAPFTPMGEINEEEKRSEA